jgi:1-acyl-sn-glycerol-3-phosphate acyltransferase
MRGWFERRWQELRSVVVYLYVALALLVVGPPMILYLLVTQDFPRAYRWGRRLLRWGLRLADLRVEVTFRADPPDPPVLFVANHQSLLDPPILLAYLPHDVRVFPKVQLFRVPIMGTLMRLAGFVPIDRERPEVARRELRKALDRLRQRVSFLIFPEGTRSRTGRLQAFRRGGFVLAIEAGVPIVPISLWGTYEALPKGAWRIRPGSVWVVVHPAVSTQGLTWDDRHALSAQVWSYIRDALPERYHPEAEGVRAGTERG